MTSERRHRFRRNAAALMLILAGQFLLGSLLVLAYSWYGLHAVGPAVLVMLALAAASMAVGFVLLAGFCAYLLLVPAIFVLPRPPGRGPPSRLRPRTLQVFGFCAAASAGLVVYVVVASPHIRADEAIPLCIVTGFAYLVPLALLATLVRKVPRPVSADRALIGLAVTGLAGYSAWVVWFARGLWLSVEVYYLVVAMLLLAAGAVTSVALTAVSARRWREAEREPGREAADTPVAQSDRGGPTEESVRA